MVPGMSQLTDKLFQEAQALPEEERALLALQLFDSVGESGPELERAWRDEVRQRLADIDAVTRCSHRGTKPCDASLPPSNVAGWKLPIEERAEAKPRSAFLWLRRAEQAR
jgi:hypothetical protein